MPLFPNARYLCSAKRADAGEKQRTLPGAVARQPAAGDRGRPAGNRRCGGPAAGRRADRLCAHPRPASPDHAALILAAGDDYACSPAISFIPRSSLPIRGGIQRSAAIPGRRKPPDGRDDGVGASHHAQWFTGHFAGSSCGWLEEDKQGDYRWREAGQQVADKGNSDE